ncbi:hypothetical protein H6P81_006005 [Aristolochia fimbriata]|uniref:Uncharacterized protein n=1 Tax=Aristolochia fimbriata TaxID=158543 RepID=A0AAV7EYX8_ARIFI|nr:hypothetical protein H6P81_006005 [Aristolochia fimbriata]
MIRRGDFVGSIILSGSGGAGNPPSGGEGGKLLITVLDILESAKANLDTSAGATASFVFDGLETEFGAQGDGRRCIKDR